MKKKGGETISVSKSSSSSTQSSGKTVTLAMTSKSSSKTGYPNMLKGRTLNIKYK